MARQQSDRTLEDLLRHVDAMAIELGIIRNTIETLLREDDKENGVDVGEGRKRSVVEVLSAAPGHRLFSSAEEVDQYLLDERTSWDS